MGDKIQIQLILEADYDNEMADIFSNGDGALNTWGKEEILKILEGDEELSADWGAKMLGITIKKE